MNVLHLRSSLSGDSSASRLIGGLLLHKLAEAVPLLDVTVRDLASEPPPHIASDFLLAPSEPLSEALRLSQRYIAEVRRADLLALEAPMYNFSVPSTVKAWIDHIVLAGETFRFTDEGSVGLLTGKRAVLVLSSGGIYSGGPGRLLDHQEPYLRDVLRFVGITEITTIRIEGVAHGMEARQAALASARQQANAFVRELQSDPRRY